MKPGAGDDPFAEESTESEEESAPESESDDAPPEHVSPESASDSAIMTSPDGHTQGQSLPYKYRRDSVKHGRNQQPVFLQSSTEDLIEETIDRIEEQFDENIYKTDVVEAMLVAGGEGTTPEAVLERWGYGLKNR